MKYDTLVERFGDQPLIESRALRLFYPDTRAMSVQLDRWVKAGRLVRLKRGAYLLPAHLRRAPAPPERLANLLVSPSYVSCERALYLHGLIPESVPLVTSVTPTRPRRLDTPVGRFAYRHVKPDWFFGYAQVQVGGGQALVALPAKALLDLVHLSRGELVPARIEALRLQNTELVDTKDLVELAGRSGTPRVRRAAARLAGWIEAERCAGEDL